MTIITRVNLIEDLSTLVGGNTSLENTGDASSVELSIENSHRLGASDDVTSNEFILRELASR